MQSAIGDLTSESMGGWHGVEQTFPRIPIAHKHLAVVGQFPVASLRAAAGSNGKLGGPMVRIAT